MIDELITPEFLERLERLRVQHHGTVAGRLQGERRSVKRGAGQEFADFREYAPGDDFRRIDWAAYARLEALYLKLFLEEEDLLVDILLDASASMGVTDPWGGFAPAARAITGGSTKLHWAARASAALGVVALAASDELRLTVMGGAESSGDTIPNSYGEFGSCPRNSPGPVLRGRPSLKRFLAALSALEAGGRAELAASARRFVAGTPSNRKGVCFLISDLWDAAGLEPALRLLLADRRSPRVLHLLSPLELDPTAELRDRDLLLVDSETGEELPLSLHGGARAQYAETLERLLEESSSACRRLGVPYVRVSTRFPLEDAFLKTFRSVGLVG